MPAPLCVHALKRVLMSPRSDEILHERFAMLTFNEWRHKHTNYDRRMSGARTLEAQRQIMEEVALQAMQRAYANGDKAFAQQIMEWAKSKRLLSI